MTFGVTSMTAPLRRVLVRRPATAGDWVGAGWRVPDAVALAAQHEAFCALLGDLGAEVEVAAALEGQVDAVYMHDPLLLTARGGIPLRMRKPARAREPAHAREELERLGVPVLGSLPEGAVDWVEVACHVASVRAPRYQGVDAPRSPTRACT